MNKTETVYRLTVLTEWCDKMECIVEDFDDYTTLTEAEAAAQEKLTAHANNKPAVEIRKVDTTLLKVVLPKPTRIK